jgi:ParB family transcriptional regulator, chromosome partitioning protein
MTRKPLGRGLSALLPAGNAGEEVQQVDIDLIQPNPDQPRTTFNESRLQELAQSIKSNGIIQPLLLRRRAGSFELVAGERRWRAAQRAGIRTIPAIIREIPDDKLLELALIENIQRQELSPIEEAQAYRKLIENLKLSHDEVAQRVGRDRSFISNYLRVLKLPADILALLADEKISMGHARALLGAATPALMRKLAQKIVEKHWSVRETEDRLRASVKDSSKPTASASTRSDPNLRAAEAKLRTQLGRQVRIVPDTGKESGRVELRYYDSSDLDSLYQRLLSRFAANM